VRQLLGVNKFKMAAVAMVTKVQKMLNSLQISQIFAVMLPVTTTSQSFMKFDEKNQKKIKSPPFLFPWQLWQFVQLGIGWTNCHSCHENKKGGDLIFFYSFHQTS
jgi:hypothetical protein